MELSTYEKFEAVIKAGDVEAVKACLAAGLLDDEYSPETNPLIIASRKGNTAILTALLDSQEFQDSFYRDISRTYENDEGTLSTTLLAEALRAGREGAARLLIQRGAYVNDSFSSFISSWADNGTGYDDVNEGICWQLASDELLEFMKDYGLNVDTSIREGYTALIKAVFRGNAERVEQLLALGADPNQSTSEHDDICGWSLLAYAVNNAQSKEGFEEFAPIIKLLLKHGAFINARVENNDYEFIPDKTVTVIDIVLEGNNRDLHELFGLQHVHQLIQRRNAEIMEGYEDFLSAVIDGKKNIRDTEIVDEILELKGGYPNTYIGELATKALGLYERFAYLGFIPSDSKGGKALDDEEIMNEFTRFDIDLDCTAFEVKVIDWLNPHEPVSEWIEVKRVPKLLSHERIQIERMRLLQIKKYFQVCQECFRRTPVGHMSGNNICQQCGQENHGVVF